MPNHLEKLQAWASEQIQLLKRQRDGLERRIAEIESFSKVLSEVGELSETKMTILLENSRNLVAHGSNNGSDTMPGRIAAILRETGRPMNAAEIAQTLESRGFKYEGKQPLKIIVSTELARQSKKHAHGIRKVGTGRYAAA